MTLPWLLLQFALCALLIGRAGYLLSVAGDRLADAHGWGRGWVGLALLATVTSLPELASGLSSVLLVDAPDLAVGNALGACVMALAFLVVIDALQRKQPMYRDASPTHLLSAAFGVVMLGFVAMSLLTGPDAPAVVHVGLYSPALLALYLFALRSVRAHEARNHAITPPDNTAPKDVDVRAEWRRFGFAAVVVVAAGIWLPQVADTLAQALGLNRSFVGTVFMALVTTLPEIAVTLAALRLAALDMAIGNLLGSNLFNLTILAVVDVAYVRAPLMASVTSSHAGTAVTGMVMTGLVIVGLVMRPQGRVLRVASWVSVGLVAAYGINASLVYLRGG